MRQDTEKHSRDFLRGTSANIIIYQSIIGRRLRIWISIFATHVVTPMTLL